MESAEFQFASFVRSFGGSQNTPYAVEYNAGCKLLNGKYSIGGDGDGERETPGVRM